MRRTQIFRGLGALLLSLLLLGAVPVALVHFVGWPLPRSGVDVTHAWQQVQARGVATGTVVKALAVVVWISWIRLVAGFAVELPRSRGGVRQSTPRRPIRALGMSQRWAAQLSGAIMLLFASGAGGRAAGASPVPRPIPIVAVDHAHVDVRPIARVEAGLPTVDGPTWTVRRNDSFWGIAESALGDGLRWREVVDANIGREVSPGIVFTSATDTIHPGWVLALPATAVAETPSVAEPDVRVPRTVVVQRGDTLGSIAEAQYGDATQWPVIWEANSGRSFGAFRFDDPNLILPGWTLTVPDDASVDSGAPTTDRTTQARTPGSPDVDRSSTSPDVTVSRTRVTRLGDAGELDQGSSAESRAGVPGAGAAAGSVGGAAPAGSVSRPSADGSAHLDRTAATPSSTAAPASVAAAAPESTPRSSLQSLAEPAGDGIAPCSAPEVAPPGAPAPTSSPTSGPATSDGGHQVPVAVPIGIASSFLAGGVLALVTARRRRRLRAARSGTSLGPEPADITELMRTLEAMSRPERSARLDVALRAAAVALAGSPRRLSVVAALVDENGGIDLVIDPAAPATAPAPFRASGSRSWSLAADVPTAEIAPPSHRFAAAPSPSMVQIGTVGDCDAFVDLEAIGLLTIDGFGADDILRCLAAALAASPFGELVGLVHVGEPPVPSLGRVSVVDSVDAALDLAAEVLTPVLGTLATGETTADLRIRSAGETWEPVVVLVPSAHCERPALGHAQAMTDPAGRGLGVVAAAESVDSSWSLRQKGTAWVLHPLGWDIRPCGLSHDVADSIDRLLDHADSVPQPMPSFDEMPLSPGWQMLVRLLGPPDVIDRSGAAASFEKSKSLELLAWLAEHREGATRVAARGALWDVEVRDATFANVVSDARRALARLVPPDGEDWLARTFTELLPLDRQVRTDLDVLRSALAAARRSNEPATRATLREAVALIRGVPFTGVAWQWVDAEALGSNAALLAVTAAVELARRELDAGDPDGALWATQQGLIALPGHEELVALRLQAHAARRDLAGLRGEWEQYERVLEADPWMAAEPSDTLLSLRAELVNRLRSR